MKLNTKDVIALLLDGGGSHKVGVSALRYLENPVVCAIHAKHIGKMTNTYLQTEVELPTVSSIEEAKALGANVILVGSAPTGGVVDATWKNYFDSAVKNEMSIISGLHTNVAELYPDLSPGQWIWDTRCPSAKHFVATGSSRTLTNKRVMMVGTDMAIGKMTAALELHSGALAKGINSGFVATGQTGITISGKGIPVDAIRIDYACGAMEAAILEQKDKEILFVEGQGSVLHPGSCAFVAIMRGTIPTHFVLCHRAKQEALLDCDNGVDWVKIPPLKKLISLYEDIGENGGSYPRPKTIGISLITNHLSATEAEAEIKRIEDATGLPCCDPIRDGVEKLLTALE